jgi:hypothetical protein
MTLLSDPADKKKDLLRDIEAVLQRDPSRMFSREEILNLLAHDREGEGQIDKLLAELEVSSSLQENKNRISDVYATCRGGTVYYRWNKQQQ